jgi:thiol:disulfide interchange protein
MARIVAFNALFFALPFIAYGIWLLATRGTATRGADWPARIVGILAVAGALLMVAALVAVIHFTAAAPGQGYRPAAIKDGVIVPGEFE